MQVVSYLYEMSSIGYNLSKAQHVVFLSFVPPPSYLSLSFPHSLWFFFTLSLSLFLSRLFLLHASRSMFTIFSGNHISSLCLLQLLDAPRSGFEIAKKWESWNSLKKHGLHYSHCNPLAFQIWSNQRIQQYFNRGKKRSNIFCVSKMVV